MTQQALAKVVQRAIGDAAFRRQLNSDPAGALRGFDLTADEVSAVRAGDAGRLSALGIDQRMSKVFIAGGSLSGPSRLSSTDMTGSPAAVDAASASAGNRMSIPSDPDRVLNADDGGGISTTRSAINDPDNVRIVNADTTSETTSSSFRTGDDWKFADRGAAQASRGSDDWAKSGFVDKSEGYLTKDAGASGAPGSAVTDAHDRGGLTAHDISAPTTPDAAPDGSAQADGTNIIPH